MILWNLEEDTFEPGQWVHARVPNFDLSDDGTFAIYFVSYHRKRPPYLWIGLSRVPLFTAEKIWKVESAWGGTCCFLDSSTILIDTAFKEDQMLDERIGRFHVLGPGAAGLNRHPDRPGETIHDRARIHKGWAIERTIGRRISPHLNEWEEVATKRNPVNQELQLVQKASYTSGKNTWQQMARVHDAWHDITSLGKADWDARGRLVYCDPAGHACTATFEDSPMKRGQLILNPAASRHFNDQTPPATDDATDNTNTFT